MASFELLIIGAGPAGLTAALYAARAKLNVAIIERDAPGGQMLKTEAIHNWPSLPGVTGSDLALKMFEQVLAYPVTYLYGAVKQIIPGEAGFKVITDTDTYAAKFVIVATGAQPRALGIENEMRLIGRGISYCAVCDGALYKDQDVAVIGGGDAALKEALYLARLARRVYLIHRRDHFRGEEQLVQEVKDNPQIEIIYQATVASIIGAERVEGLVIKSLTTSDEHIVTVAAVFPFIGHTPATAFLEPLGVLDEFGYVLTDATMATTIKGLYACGDVRQKGLRQIITASNDGAIAADVISKQLAEGHVL